MILTANTNVLVRAVVGDDPQQSAIASATLRQADAIAVDKSQVERQRQEPVRMKPLHLKRWN